MGRPSHAGWDGGTLGVAYIRIPDPSRIALTAASLPEIAAPDAVPERAHAHLRHPRPRIGMAPEMAYHPHGRRTTARLALLHLLGLLLAGCDLGGTDPVPVAPEPIAFIGWDGTVSSERVYLVDADGQNLRPLPLAPPRRALSWLSWAPD